MVRNSEKKRNLEWFGWEMSSKSSREIKNPKIGWEMSSKIQRDKKIPKWFEWERRLKSFRVIKNSKTVWVGREVAIIQGDKKSGNGLGGKGG